LVWQIGLQYLLEHVRNGSACGMAQGM